MNYRDEPSYYDVALVCMNGHMVNDSYGDCPQHNSKFCAHCGAATIYQCPACQQPIRGQYNVPGVMAVAGAIPVPVHCHHCGHAYPWTEARKAAARELIDEMAELSVEEKGEFTRSLDVLMESKPGGELAQARIKRLLGKLGKGTYGVVKDVLTDILSDVVKKAVFGPGA